MFADPPGEVEVVVQQILPNPMVVFARADHALASAKHIPFARLAQEPFLLREPGSGTRTAAEEIFAQHGLRPQVRMELATNEAIKEAILAGLGVSILSRYTLGLEAEQTASHASTSRASRWSATGISYIRSASSCRRRRRRSWRSRAITCSNSCPALRPPSASPRQPSIDELPAAAQSVTRRPSVFERNSRWCST